MARLLVTLGQFLRRVAGVASTSPQPVTEKPPRSNYREAAPEQRWLQGEISEEMLPLLRERASDRKLRLFACACFRRIWHLLPDEQSHNAVEVAERFADGEASEQELAIARDSAQRFPLVTRVPRDRIVWDVALESAWDAAKEASEAAAKAAAWYATDSKWFHPCDLDTFRFGKGSGFEWGIACGNEQMAQAVLLLDVFANPFRTPPPIDPSWLRWNDGTVVKLAQGIYDERRFADLPILADALEEAGCTDEAILSHCRQPGEHFRGCWVVDALLGKA